MITTIIWLVVLQRLQKDEPRSYRSIGRKLVEKLYFWKYVACIVIVCAYRVMVFVNNIGLPGAYYYIFAPLEQIASTMLMLVSNFRIRPNGNNWIKNTFKAVLIAAAIENLTLMMVASGYISLHILTLPLDLTQSSTIYYAINLTLLAVNAKYRWIVADYFLAKTFLKKDCCILRDVGDSGELWPEDEDECEERNEEETEAN
ncbi:uncharacterized protein [Ptychodera flava]|uniref:uncharacterized protein n=1 Tax=Ptychodera flava TaxID=63121 RepID=UPI00396A2E0B